VVVTRAVKVAGKQYLQVVEYKKIQDGKTKVKVVKTFGENTLENKMRAEQFSLSHNQLKELAIKHKKQNDSDEILSASLAIFGSILGLAIVVGVINEFARR